VSAGARLLLGANPPVRLTRRASTALREARETAPDLVHPGGKAVDGLKFSAALPRNLAEATLAQRLADLDGARIALAEPKRFVAA
jgi:ATP-dependent helicase Lhr and Lhr-like helicase